MPWYCVCEWQTAASDVKLMLQGINDILKRWIKVPGTVQSRVVSWWPGVSNDDRSRGCTGKRVGAADPYLRLRLPRNDLLPVRRTWVWFLEPMKKLGMKASACDCSTGDADRQILESLSSWSSQNHRFQSSRTLCLKKQTTKQTPPKQEKVLKVLRRRVISIIP